MANTVIFGCARYQPAQGVLAAADSQLAGMSPCGSAGSSRWVNSNRSFTSETLTASVSSRNRTVPISAELFKELKAKGNGKVYPDVDYLLVRQLLKEIAPDLPKGQAIHALRHTFASHFMMNGGNILTLQKILDHSNILQTMTYAHLAPDYLQDAVRFNPLADR
ncbi:tyrosine-type recombinase/integrase [Yersinia ruckeri]|nr:tyrosine-type recombinase/integrase [Yersinia ruckeri]MCW6538536.1 tyrosine-type recombinase/integrase [Yersinia ruckeri]UZY10084.1 tyrosine-type recombinase/integrase [Yersinia ruckeri]